MLKEYDSRPCTVLACLIEETGVVTKLKEKDKSSFKYKYTHKGRGASTTLLEFNAPEKPEVGDYIIMASKTDVYHCDAKLFAKKYTRKGMSIL
jgi:hypothetical protein